MDKTKILLVDDEGDFLEIMGRRIKSWGYQVIPASNGKEALDVLTKQAPDIVILDYLMPGMDGIATLEEIRKIDKEIPVIMLTAHPEAEAIKGTKKFKADILIPKLSLYSDVTSALRMSIERLEKKLDKEKKRKVK